MSKKALAMIKIGADSKRLAGDLRDAKKKLSTFGADTKKAFKGAAKSLAMGMGAGLGFGAAGGLANLVSGTVEDVMNVEKALTRLQIAGGMSTEELAGFRTTVGQVSKATGITREEIVKGAAAYVAMTGDAKGAAEASQLFAEIAAGSGASMDDVAKSAAALRQNLKIDPKDFRKAFDVLIKQGQLGAVEISDLSTQLAAIAPQFGNFTGSQTVEGMSELGAMLQVVRQGFGSVEESGTGFRGLMVQLEKNAKKLKKVGVNILDPKTGKMKNMLAIVKEIAGNKELQKPGRLLETLGEAKAVQALGLLVGKLEEVEQIKQDSLGSDQVAKNNALWQASAAGKMQKAMETLKVTVAEAFTPERIEKFTNALVHAMETAIRIGMTIKRFIDDPSKFVDDEDEKIGRERGATLTDEERSLSPAQKRERSAVLMRKYAVMETRGHQGDRSGREQDQLAAQLQSAAVTLLDRANKEEGYRINGPANVNVDKIAAAIRAGLAGLSLKMDTPAAAKAAANSPHQRAKR